MSTERDNRWSDNQIRSSLQIHVFTWRDIVCPMWKGVLDRIHKQNLRADQVPKQWNVDGWPNMQKYEQWMRPFTLCLTQLHRVVILMFSLVRGDFCTTSKPTEIEWWNVQERQQIPLAYSLRYSDLSCQSTEKSICVSHSYQWEYQSHVSYYIM